MLLFKHQTLRDVRGVYFSPIQQVREEDYVDGRSIILTRLEVFKRESQEKMCDNEGICGRNKEIQNIRSFLETKIKARKSGILYLTGPPGTGKSMSIRYVLDQIKDVPTFNLNCLKVQSSKQILTQLCKLTGLTGFTKCNESEMLSRLEKKFTGRTGSCHIIVLDEMDQLPNSKNVDLIRTIFNWPTQPNSKLILVGIANTVNLTSRYQTISNILGHDSQHFTKIIFKPYSSNDIKDILLWYLENDENFEDAHYDSKVLDLIAKRTARENGDIRGALNYLKTAFDDTTQKNIKCPELSRNSLLTPPSTPPSSPCKEKTNLASVANSVKKRQRITNYEDDDFPFPCQIILSCIIKISSKSKDSSADSRLCRDLAQTALKRFGLGATREEYSAILDNIELAGLIGFKKSRATSKIVLKVSEIQLDNLIARKDVIMNLLNSIK